MNNRQHALRNIVLKLNVSGTAEVLDEQRLYKDSYGFIKLQVYAPKTQNTEAPVCTAFRTTTDGLGREIICSKNYPLLYVGEFELDGKDYLLFESYLPKEFTETVTQPNGLNITINYYDSAVLTDERGIAILEESGVPKRYATDLLASSRYTTTVYPGGWNNEGVELDVNAGAAAQIAENMRDIDELQSDVAGIRKHTEEVYEEAMADAKEFAKAVAKDTAETAAATAVKPYVEQAQAAQAKAETARAGAETARIGAEQARTEAGQFSKTAESCAESAAGSVDEVRKVAEEAKDSIISANYKAVVAWGFNEAVDITEIEWEVI